MEDSEISQKNASGLLIKAIVYVQNVSPSSIAGITGSFISQIYVRADVATAQ